MNFVTSFSIRIQSYERSGEKKSYITLEKGYMIHTCDPLGPKINTRSPHSHPAL